MTPRRDFLRCAAALAATPLLAQDLRAQSKDDDSNGIKIAHRLDYQGLTDDDLLFLQQIGLRWVRVEFGDGPLSLDQLRAAQQRFARFGMKIFSGVHYSYRSTRLQL